MFQRVTSQLRPRFWSLLDILDPRGRQRAFAGRHDGVDPKRPHQGKVQISHGKLMASNIDTIGS